ncbi:MAG: tyrosine--tRNA ligase [Rhodothalassiaceae bacterium]
MTGFQSEFLQTLSARGFIHQQTDEAGLDALLMAGGPVPCYIGFDCTAPSLHVGSLVQIMMLRHAQKAGLKPIVLLGGGTTKIGDPSGKDESRRLLDEADIAANMAGIRAIFTRFLDFGDGPTDALLVDNAEWLDRLGYIAFLREIGPHFTINRMLGFDSVRLRLEREQPLSFLEFNYMILQAYDFVELAKRHGCRLQMGGSDQWGNIVNGIELGRRIAGLELYGLTTPLLTTAAGTKMGKTAAGAVWLNEDMLSAFDYYQFWRNADDADVGRFLRLFTDLPLEEILRLEALEGEKINEAKKRLAFEATALARGREAAESAHRAAIETFEQGIGSAGLPSVALPAARLAAGLSVLDAFLLAGLAGSKREVRRLIEQGGARVNDAPVRSDEAMLGPDDLRDGAIKLSAGRKRHILLRPE